MVYRLTCKFHSLVSFFPSANSSTNWCRLFPQLQWLKNMVLSKQYHGDCSIYYSTGCILNRKQMITASRPLDIWWRDNLSDHGKMHGEWTRNSLFEKPFLLGISNVEFAITDDMGATLYGHSITLHYSRHLLYSVHSYLFTKKQSAPLPHIVVASFLSFTAFSYQIFVCLFILILQKGTYK